MPSLLEYTKNINNNNKSIVDYAKNARDLDLGLLQNKERYESIQPPQFTGQESENEKRMMTAQWQAKKLEALGEHKKAYDLLKAEQEYQSGSKGFFAPLFQGIGDVAVGAGQALDYVGKKFDTDAFQNTASFLKEYGGTTEETFRNYEVEKKLGEFSWDDLINLEFYHQNILRALPFAAALLPAGLVATYASIPVGTAVAESAGLGSFGTVVAEGIASLAGNTLLSRPIESSIEAGQTYNSVLQKTGDEELAQNAADEVFKKNMMLGGMDAAEMLLAFTPAKKIPFLKSSKLLKSPALKTGAKLLGGGAMEATEEILQSKFQTEAEGGQFSLRDPETQLAGVVGGLMGVGTGGLGEIMVHFQQKVKNKLPNKAKEDYEKAKEENIKKGMTEQQAEIRAMDEMTEKNEAVAKLTTQKALEEFVDEAEAQEKTVTEQPTIAEQEKEYREQQQRKEQIKEQEQPKKIKINKKHLTTTDGVNEFLNENFDIAKDDETLQEKAFNLLDAIYDYNKQIEEYEAKKEIGKEPKLDFGEMEDGYQEFKKLVRGFSTEKLETGDYKRLEELFKKNKKDIEKLENILNEYAEEKNNDEVYSMFVDRLIKERNKDKKGRLLKPNKTKIKEAQEDLLKYINEHNNRKIIKRENESVIHIPDKGVYARITPEQQEYLSKETQNIKFTKDDRPHLSPISSVVRNNLKEIGVDEIRKISKNINEALANFEKTQKTKITKQSEKTTPQKPVKSKGKVLASQRPVGEKNKRVFSKYYKRVIAGTALKAIGYSGKYTVAESRAQANKAYRFVTENWDQAVEIALGYKHNNTNVLDTHIRSVVIAVALEDGDLALAQSVAKAQQQSLTRKGQEISAAKDVVDPNSPEKWIRDLLRERIKKLDYKIYEENDTTMMKLETKQEKIDNGKKKLKKVVEEKVKQAVDVQKIINSIIC